MAVSAIAFTMYPVTDMERAVAFYHGTLGLAKAGVETAYWVEFEIANTTFGIGNFEQVGKPGTAQSLALEVSDLEAFRKELAERGVESSTPFETQICFISGVHDPDGNQIWLHEAKARAA
jgi:predicted enzyme related to lactoylglutathione lyase